MKKQMLFLISLLTVFTLNGARAGNGAGEPCESPIYFDRELFTIEFMEFTPATEAFLLQNSNALNHLYELVPGLPDGEPFVSVVDTLPAEGFDPVYQSVHIEFADGCPPRQLYSDWEINDAEAVGEITLTCTDEVYWCPINWRK